MTAADARFIRNENWFPVDVKFLGTEKLTVNLTLADGSNKALALDFPAKTITIANTAGLPAALTDLA